MVSAAVVNRLFAGSPGRNRRRPDFGSLGPALHLAGIAVLTLVLASSGAFDSDRLPWARRMLMFGIVSTLLIAQASLLADTARRLAGAGRLRRSAAAALALAGTVLLMTLEIHALKWTPFVPYPPDPLLEFAFFLTPLVASVGGLVLGLKWVGEPAVRPGRRAAAPAPVREPTGGAEPVVRGDVVRVQAVDHYLHVWTPDRTSLVRGRMRDALDLLSTRPGVQPHRSWWVAASEIERMEARGRDHSLVLRDGTRVPVARARMADVRRFLNG